MIKQLIGLLMVVLLAGCVSVPPTQQAPTCADRMSQSMKNMEPFSAAASNMKWRDDKEKPYIHIVPVEGFREKMLSATTEWEQVKSDCWPESLKKNAPVTPYKHSIH